MGREELTPLVEWIAPDDSLWLQSADAPPGLVERICDGFRVAVLRKAPGEPPLAWQASVMQKGGVAFLDPPAASSDLSLEQAAALLLFSHRAYFPGASMIQLMLPMGVANLEAAARSTGLVFAADLLLLGRSCSVSELEPPDPAMRFEPCGPELPSVLSGTYEATLDCPMLTGKRPISDVIEGYAATGDSGKNHWRTAWVGGGPIGCVLVATHSQLEIAELVYMGVIPAVRGMGIGGHLLMEAERLALANGFSKLVIGVDARNRPARNHYEAAGYVVWEQKRVFLGLPEQASR